MILEGHELAVERGGRVVASAEHLTLGAGQTLALLGPNGAGKSSLLLALATLLPARGRLLVDGAPIVDTLAYRRRIGVVLQRPVLLDRTVLENVRLPLALRGTDREETESRAMAALARLRISELAHRAVRGLSGGEAQRVSIARAIAPRPDLLFLDEPFGALDGPTREGLIADLARVLREQGTGTVLVTHDRDEALSLGDQVGIVLGGRVRQLDRADIVFAAPSDPEVADFVGVENIIPAHVSSVADDLTELRIGDQTVETTSLPPPGDTFPLLCVAADDVVLSRGEISSSARNHYGARVVRVEPIGRRVRVVLDCGFPLVAHVTHRSARELALRAGDQVTASFKATVPHLLPRHRRA